MFKCDVIDSLKRIESKLDAILAKEIVMAGELDTLTAQVTKNTDAEQSAILLIQGLAATIASLKTDPVALQALSDKLKGSADALAAAILANTPVP